MSPTRTFARLALAAALPALLVTFMPAGASHGSDPTQSAPTSAARASTGGLTVAGGGAYGTAILGNAVAESGRTAFTTMCTSKYPSRSRNYVAGTGEATEGMLEAGAVETLMRSYKNDSGQKVSRASTNIARADLGGGAVALRGLTSIAEAVEVSKPRGATPGAYETSHSVTIVALSIGGQKIPLDQEVPSQKIEVPGVATVWLSRQYAKKTATDAVAQTIALKVRLADGTKIHIGRSRATLGSKTDGAFSGGAWGTDVSVLGVVGSGKTANQPLPCRGLYGAEKTNNTAAVTVPGVGTIGATVSTAATQRFSDGARMGVTTSKIAGIDLGDGALVIDAIEVSAAVLRKAGGKIERQPTVRILGLTVGGEPTDVPLAGERIDIPGLGYIALGDVVEKKGSLKVVGLKVVLLDTGDPEGTAGSGAVEVNLGNAVTRVRL